MEKLFEKLNKIEALAQSGIGGERENAQQLLDALCAKYGVTLDQLCDEKKEWIRFTIKDRLDEKLLMQIVAHVCKTNGCRFARTKNKRQNKDRWFELTKTQELDVRECYEHYRKLWLKNLDDVMSAFIQANSIFGPPKDEDCEMPTHEEIERLLKLRGIMSGLESDPWKKILRLNNGQ